MSKIIKYFFITIIALLAILMVVPFLVPMDSYKTPISATVKKVINRDLAINGSINLSLFPIPQIKLQKVTLSSIPEASNPFLVEVGEAKASLSIPHLLSGKIVITYVELDKPIITLEKLKNGKANWEFAESRPSTPIASDNFTKTESLQEKSSVFVEHIKINHGTVKYIDGIDKKTVEDINIDLKAAGLEGPIDFFINLHLNGQSYDLKGNIKEIAKIIPITLNLSSSLGLAANIKGTLDTESTLFKGDLKTHGNLKKILPSADIPKGLAGDYKLITNIDANKESVNLSMIDFAIGDIKARGSAGLKLAGSKPKISINLETSNLRLDTLETQPPSSLSSNTQATLASGGEPWSRQKIDLSLLKAFDCDVVLSIPKFTKGTLVLDNVKTKIQLADGVLDIKSLSFNTYGGRIDLSGAISSKTNVVAIKSSVQNLQLRNFSPTGKIKVTDGTININANLKSQGDSLYQYVNNLAGNVRLDGANGRLTGISLQKIIDTLNNLKNLETIISGLNKSFEGGETEFKSLDADLLITNGIAKLTKSKIEAQGAHALASGTIDLPRYLMNIDAIINVDVKNMPPFKVILHGPLDAPKHKLDTGALQKYLLNNVLGNVIDNIKSGKTKPKDILKGVVDSFGKKQQSNSDSSTTPNHETEPQGASESKDPVNNLIKKGIKELFKK